jgi:hypothetical protein
MRKTIADMTIDYPQARLTRVLDALGLARSRRYYQAVPASQRRRPGPTAQPIPDALVAFVKQTRGAYPWYGYQKIAVICRRAGQPVTDRQVFQVMLANPLLHKPPVTEAVS